MDAAEGVAEWAAQDIACVVLRAWIDPGHSHDQPVSILLPLCWAVTFPERSGRTVAFVRRDFPHRMRVATWSLAGFTLLVLEAALVLAGLA